MGAERVFGHIPGYPEGSCFGSRVELSQAGVHRPLIAGISGTGRTGATSVVLAGGYEDTEDFGAEILYTGHGGRDPETGRQRAHQTLTRGNLALAGNKHSDLLVRVIRGARQHSPYAPEAGYRYDGLYRVVDYWREIGKAGFYIWRFRLIKKKMNHSYRRWDSPHVITGLSSTDNPCRPFLPVRDILCRSTVSYMPSPPSLG